MVQLISFTPYALAGSLVSLLAVVLLRRWIPALLIAISVSLFVLAVGPRAVGSPESVETGRPVRLLAANLKVGRADPTSLIDLAIARDVDLLVLSEVPAEARPRLIQAGLDRLYPNKRMAFAPGRLGTGIWSRWPLSGITRLQTRQPQLITTVQVPDSIPFDLAAIHTEAPIGRQSTGGWNSDFDRLPPAGSRSLPLVLAGDFNATLDHARLRTLIDTGYRDAGAATGRGLAFTWPSAIGWPPPVTLDHVLAESGIGFSDYDVERLDGSDHRAVLVELVLPGSR